MEPLNGHRVTVANDVALTYEVHGRGEPAILIGTGPIADSFRPFLTQQALVERYQLITYRQRRPIGNGHTPAPVSYVEHAADAAALLDHLGIRRAHVAGHSTGAIIALQLAVDRPDLVHTLALLEPLQMFSPGVGALVERLQPALAAYGAGNTEAAMASFLSVACSLDWETCRTVIDNHVPGGVARAIADASDVFDSYLPALGAWRFGPEQAATITQPVLSVLGTRTEQVFVEGNALLHAWFPQVEDCTIHGVAHLLHMQDAEPVARGVAGFLGRHPITHG
jgi:pimeloyl-ACP methyl ester carboxylesterase